MKLDLREIYNFIKQKSPQAAKNVLSDLRAAPKSIKFSKQNEVETYNRTYLRIIVRNYKILYRIKEDSSELVIFTIFDTRQHPDKLSEK